MIEKNDFWEQQTRLAVNNEIANHTAMVETALRNVANSPGGINTPVIVDAFSMQFLYGFRYAYSQMLLLAGMDNLRRAQGNYRPQLYVMPEEDAQIIPAYESTEYQVNIPVGSYVWGVFCPRLNTGDFSRPSVQLLVGQSQYPLFSRQTKLFASAGNVQSVISNAVTYCGIFNPPLIITGTGPTAPVSVQIANTETQERRYVVLFAAVPKMPKPV